VSDNPFEGFPMFGDLAKMFASQGPLNWEVARQLAVWLATGGTPEPNVDPLQRMKLEELARVAEMHVADATGLPTSTTGSVVTVLPVGRAEWATRTLTAYRPLLERLATSLTPPAAEAEQPDAAAGLLGSLTQMMSPVLLGMQSGFMVGHLSQQALGQYELPVPRHVSDELLLVAPNVDAFADDWSLSVDDVRMWVCLDTLIHHAVLGRPHVRARLDELLREYVSGFEVNASALDEKLAEVDPADPASFQRVLGDTETLFGAMQSDAQRALMPRLEALTCVIAGYVDHTMDRVGSRLVGSYGPLTEALRRRRAERAQGDRFVERLFGVELGQPQYERGTGFVRGVVERAGEAGLARLWPSARELPTPAEVDAPGLWLERIDLPDRT
jgi:putative hydrolase